jgi:Cupin domain
VDEGFDAAPTPCMTAERVRSTLVRHLTTGVNDQGRSCVVSDVELTLSAAGGTGPAAVERLFVAEELPPPEQPAGSGDKSDLGVRRGLDWRIVRWQPGGESPRHYTDTVDLDVILDGDIELVLDDGPHRLEPGDTAVIQGVDHAWRAGPDGCTMCIAVISAPRR